MHACTPHACMHACIYTACIHACICTACAHAYIQRMHAFIQCMHPSMHVQPIHRMHAYHTPHACISYTACMHIITPHACMHACIFIAIWVDFLALVTLGLFNASPASVYNAFLLFAAVAAVI